MELKEHYGAEVSRSVQCGCYTKRVSARTTRHSTELLYDLAKYRQGSCLVDHCTRRVLRTTSPSPVSNRPIACSNVLRTSMTTGGSSDVVPV